MNAENHIGGEGTPMARMADARGAEALVRLDNMDDYQVASGDPDPKGWDVKARDGEKVGTVKHLLVDPRALRVRYLEVELDRGQPGAADRRCVHIPVGSARLHDDDDEVIVDIGAAAIELLGTANAEDMDRPDDAADDLRFFGGRRAGRENAQYLVRTERRY